MQRSLRLKRELEDIMKSPPRGISCTQKGDKLDVLEASIMGVEGTPYEAGVFRLELHIPEKYPFQPPRLLFTTPIYHPNVDAAGRICLDMLSLPPKGSWRPVVTISGLLTAVQILLAQPNPDDPLMPDIADEFYYNKEEYIRKAKEWTSKYACPEVHMKDKVVNNCDETNKRKRNNSEELSDKHRKCESTTDVE